MAWITVLFFTLPTVSFLLSLAYNLNKLMIYCRVEACYKYHITQKFFFLFSSISKACKFDFEAGAHGWKRTGTAFNNQPTYGDNPTARNREPANQQGDWWIGGFENRPSQAATPGAVQGDGPQGTLASPFFKIVGKRISFLIGGGCDIKKVRAELIVDHQVRQPDRIAFSF